MPKVVKNVAAVAISIFLLLSLIVSGMWLAAWCYQKQLETMFTRAFALRVGETTFAQAQEFAKLYKSDLIIQSKSCEAASCWFHIASKNFLPTVIRFPGEEIALRALAHFGLRAAGGSVDVSVKDGRVSYVGYHIYYFAYGISPQRAEIIAVDVFTQDEMSRNHGLQRHPGYLVSDDSGLADFAGSYIRAEYIPTASASERHRAQFIDFSCMTRVRECEPAYPGKKEFIGVPPRLLPLAYEDLVRDSALEKEYCKQHPEN